MVNNIKNLFIILFFIFLSSIAYSGAIPSPTMTPVTVYDGFATNGVIYAVTRAANVVYLGGSFTNIGKRVGMFYFCDYNGDQITTPRMPQVDGNVYAIAPDGNGGFYIGGSFLYVGGLPRTRLAHILNTGEVDPNWTPSANNVVRVITIGGDGRIYIGGSFTQITGSDAISNTRNYIAALDPISGNVLGFNISCDSTIYDINYYSNIRLIIAGSFTTVSDIASSYSIPYLAVIDPTGNSGTGSVLDINHGINGPVYTIARPKNSTQTYIGGSFTQVNGSTIRNRIAMYSTFMSITPTAQNFDVNGTVYSLLFENSNSTLYATGNFTTVNGGSILRNYAAAFSTSTAQATSFNPDLNKPGNCLASNGTNIYIGGYFDKVNMSRSGGAGIQRLYAAAFDKTTGEVNTSWLPELNNYVLSIAPVTPSSTNIAIGGSFRAAKTKLRNRLAAIDILTDTIYAWNPDVNGTVYALALTNTAVYAGGDFTTVNSSIARNRLAAFDTNLGNARSWNPNVNNTVYTLLPVGNYMYIGGNFTKIGDGGTTRNYGAAVDLNDGTSISSWDPNTNGAIRDLAELNGIIYAGGNFTTTGGGVYTRNYAAAFSLISGVTQPWNPDCNNFVNNVETLYPNTIFLAGNFTTVSEVSRNYIAAVDTSGNLIPSFNPNLNNYVNGLYINNNTLFMAGNFTTINGFSRPYVAVWNLLTSKLSDWYPNPNSTLNCVTSFEDRVFLAGFITQLSYLPHGYGAVIGCPIELFTPTSTATRTYTRTSTRTFTPTRTNTFTYTPTFTYTSTPSATPTRTITPTITPTATKTSTPTSTFTNVPVYSYPFFDNFSNNLDWDYGPEWERGPAITPFATPYVGYPDPVSDVSSTDDNYIAGTVIGGNMSTSIHPFYYLTSPFIDASSATKLQLRFYRYLNCDWAQYISATVEVYDGTSWITIYTNPPNTTVSDNEWTEMVFDVTNYKSNRFRVRFGHSVNLSGAYIMSGWNLDDIYIGHPFTPTITKTFTYTLTNTPTWTQTITLTNTPTNTPTYTSTYTPTYTPTNTATNTPTKTVTLTGTPTWTLTRTPTYTMTYTSTITPTFTYTVTPTFTVTPTITLTFTISPTWTNIIYSPTITPTHSISPTFTNTGTWTITFTDTPTNTSTYTFTNTFTYTYTGTPTWTPTNTSTWTLTETPTVTLTNTPTNTSTYTSTSTNTFTYTYTATLTYTNTFTFTRTNTPSYTLTVTLTKTNTPRPTGTFTETPSITNTVTQTITLTQTFTNTITDTFTITPTVTYSFTLTPTETPSFTETNTFTYTITETVTNTETPTDTLTPTPTETLCMAGILGNNSYNTSQISGGSSLYASKFELLQGASIRKLYVYIESGSGLIMTAIYTDLSGQPDTLFYPCTPQECTAGWNEFNIPFVHLSAGYYWLAIQAQAGIKIGYISGVPAGSGVSTSNIFGTFPDPFGEATPLTRLWSIYAEFCPDVGYLVTATITPTITITSTNTMFLTPTPTYTSTPEGPPIPKEGQAYAYPVPADSKITFVYSLNENSAVTIFIFDFAGNLVKEEKFTVINSNLNKSEVYINNLSPGIYYYLIKAKTTSGKEIKFKLNKFIIKR